MVPPLWVDDLVHGLLAGGFTVSAERGSAKRPDRWSNRATSVHLLRAVQNGTIDVDDAATANAEDDGRWLLASLETVDELVGSSESSREDH